MERLKSVLDYFRPDGPTGKNEVPGHAEQRLEPFPNNVTLAATHYVDRGTPNNRSPPLSRNRVLAYWLISAARSVSILN